MFNFVPSELLPATVPDDYCVTEIYTVSDRFFVAEPVRTKSMIHEYLSWIREDVREVIVTYPLGGQERVNRFDDTDSLIRSHNDAPYIFGLFGLGHTHWYRPVFWWRDEPRTLDRAVINLTRMLSQYPHPLREIAIYNDGEHDYDSFLDHVLREHNRRIYRAASWGVAGCSE